MILIGTLVYLEGLSSVYTEMVFGRIMRLFKDMTNKVINKEFNVFICQKCGDFLSGVFPGTGFKEGEALVIFDNESNIECQHCNYLGLNTIDSCHFTDIKTGNYLIENGHYPADGLIERQYIKDWRGDQDYL